jgi:serine/threonine protein kinase
LNGNLSKGEWDIVMLQLNWELVNITWSKARTAKDIPKIKNLRTERELLSRQLGDLGESAMTRVELTNRVTALHEKLNLSYYKLVDEDTVESIDAAEKCEEALAQLETQMTLVGIPFLVESEFKVGDSAITLANTTAQHPSDILFGSFECSHILKGREKHEVAIKLSTTSRNISHEAAMLEDLKGKESGCIRMYCAAVENVPRPYIVLEHYGSDLSSILAPKTKYIRRDVMQQVFAAVKHLHLLGIMHGDIKPQNILIKQLSLYVYDIKLCDLDSARYVNPIDGNRVGSDSLFPHENGRFKYTPGWEAPEMHTDTPGELKASLQIDLFSLGLVLDVLLRDVCSSSTTVLPTDKKDRVTVLTSTDEEGMKRCLQSHILYRSVVEKLCSLRPNERGEIIDRDINIIVNSGTATGLHERTVELETAKKHNAFLEGCVSTSLDDLRQGMEGLSHKLDEVMSTIRAGFDSVHEDVEGVGRCVTHQLVKQRQLGQESNDAIHTSLEALITASQRTSDSLGTLSNDSQQAVRLLVTLQGSVASFRDEASEETREHAEALARHLSEVIDELRSCSGRGGDNSQLIESAMREMTVQMATMTSELTAIRKNVSRILAEMANLGNEMSRVVEGNAALQNKLFDLSDGLSQMDADDTKKYTDLRNKMSAFQVTGMMCLY